MKKLWPEVVAETTFEGFKPRVSVEGEIVPLGKSMDLEVDERNVNKLVKEYSQKLTTEELQLQRHTEVLQEIDYEKEPEEEEVISTSAIKEILGMWERVHISWRRNTQKKLQLVMHQSYLMTLA